MKIIYKGALQIYTYKKNILEDLHRVFRLFAANSSTSCTSRRRHLQILLSDKRKKLYKKKKNRIGCSRIYIHCIPVYCTVVHEQIATYLSISPSHRANIVCDVVYEVPIYGTLDTTHTYLVTGASGLIEPST